MGMTGRAEPPFDIFSLSKDVQDRFGWSNDDLNKVMTQLMPAALNGFQYFGFPFSGTGDQAPATSGLGQNPFAGFLPFAQQPDQTALMPFFGPEPVQQALAAQISGMTGLQRDAIQEMMPVAATLAMGQVARPFVHGEARNLLDAYLRGFARGRPKPQPTPVDYLQGYTEAVQSFWGAFMQPAAAFMQPAPGDAPEPEAEEEEELAPEIEDTDGAGDDPSEFDEMMTSWMAAGRDFQSSQFKAFDSFFEQAARRPDTE
ncbi:hypothetical protein E1180_19200 [Roseibium denhamense]|uniref:DUF937 domain-containing protein n=2 Tax=Roseibium denhamense TaxID=76305 RepID=A0ABY1P399_9HYPH|nr:hypothetical protein [Roseibium denhamense]SMP24226.1 hypothetical protein SAMN06265374_2398 [Roseibium denhamense]